MDKWRIFGAAVIGALVVSGVLGGCDPGGSPVVTETPSASGVATPTASASAEVSASPSASPGSRAWVLERLPKDALYPDIGGAKKTAEIFVELYGTMLQTGDTTLWDALSGNGCGYCASQSANVVDMVDRGYAASGGDAVVDVTQTRAAAEDDGFTYVRVVATFDDLYLVAPDGAKSLAEPSSTSKLGLQMEFIDGIWIVNGVNVD